MLNIAVCDDNVYYCSEIETIAIEYGRMIAEDIKVEVFYSAEELYTELCNGFYCDMIFLDIELVSMSGIELGEKIRNELKNELVQLVYISAYRDYALALFKVRPLNFIIKPIKQQDVEAAIDKVMELSNRNGVVFRYKWAGGEFKIPIPKILYFKRSGRAIELCTMDANRKIYDSLEELNHELEVYRFFICHQSYLVNYFHVKEFYYDELVLTNNEHIPISQKKRKIVRALQKKLGKEGF